MNIHSSKYFDLWYMNLCKFYNQSILPVRYFYVYEQPIIIGRKIPTVQLHSLLSDFVRIAYKIILPPTRNILVEPVVNHKGQYFPLSAANEFHLVIVCTCSVSEENIDQNMGMMTSVQ